MVLTLASTRDLESRAAPVQGNTPEHHTTPGTPSTTAMYLDHGPRPPLSSGQVKILPLYHFLLAAIVTTAERGKSSIRGLAQVPFGYEIVKQDQPIQSSFAFTQPWSASGGKPQQEPWSAAKSNSVKPTSGAGRCVYKLRIRDVGVDRRS